MFEVGKFYSLTFGTRDDYQITRVKVLAWQPPLLKYQASKSEGETILNTSSPTFYEAKLTSAPQDADAYEAAFSISEATT
jgi:hypothetical protein